MQHATCRAGLVSSSNQANLVIAEACCATLGCTQETEQSVFANTCMIIVVAIMRVISLVCCDEHHNTAAGCKTVCTKACFNLLAKSLDLDICPGQNTTQFLYYACSLEEVSERAAISRNKCVSTMSCSASKCLHDKNDSKNSRYCAQFVQ